MTRFELATYAMPLRRSSQLSYIPKDGGAEGTRIPDLLNANQAFYQLNYRPEESDERTGEDFTKCSSEESFSPAAQSCWLETTASSAPLSPDYITLAG